VSNAESDSPREESIRPEKDENRDNTREKQQPKPESQASQAQQPDLKQEQAQTAAAQQSSELPPETDAQREARLMLQQIPDDPGGLLRRKFLYQSRQRGGQQEADQSW
jgi:Ca-activated chloride channel family protein